ncbi:C2H2 finger domain protein [Penicillium vulpinum]|uniref:C2H2 finger domain protein n=1 Tax=Penicillium vulpinum TaxID=29845 RepID=UPI0025493565|nr:C2H2 finger domain protein [Penicillium vulpinum]KAJ5960723.1 C2H2 finger domain protein [Penicillium vulpinum]
MMEEELKYHQQFMDGFLKAIQTSNDADVHHIIDVVRSGSSTMNRVLTDNRSSYNDVPKGGPLRGWPKRKASKSATSDYLIAQLLDPSEIQSDSDSAQQPVSVPHELSRATKEYLEKSENLEMLCE